MIATFLGFAILGYYLRLRQHYADDIFATSTAYYPVNNMRQNHHLMPISTVSQTTSAANFRRGTCRLPCQMKTQQLCPRRSALGSRPIEEVLSDPPPKDAKILVLGDFGGWQGTFLYY